MRYKEFLIERVSLTQHSAQLTKHIRSYIASVVKQNYQRYLLPKESSDFIFELVKILKLKLAEVLQHEIKNITNYDVNVKFIVLDDKQAGKYHYKSNTMYLNENFLMRISNQYSMLLATQLAHKPKEDQAIFTGGIQLAVAELVSIILHECTHVIQEHKANSDELTTSYIDSKRDNIHLANMIIHDSNAKQEYEKIIGRELTADEMQYFYDVYLSQPKEIVAYAHQTAVDILKTIMREPNESQIKLIQKEFNKIKNNSVRHKYSHMSNSNNLRYQTVYRRFLKELYLELNEYIKTHLTL